MPKNLCKLIIATLRVIEFYLAHPFFAALQHQHEVAPCTEMSQHMGLACMHIVIVFVSMSIRLKVGIAQQLVLQSNWYCKAVGIAKQSKRYLMPCRATSCDPVQGTPHFDQCACNCAIASLQSWVPKLCIYTYIYIERERESKTSSESILRGSPAWVHEGARLHANIELYIYIYIYI